MSRRKGAVEMPTPSPPPVFLFATRTVARFLFALPFVASGIVHFALGGEMAAMVPVAGGVAWVYLTGAALIAAGIGIATRRLGMWAALGLSLLLLTFIVAVHLPGLTHAATRQMALGNLIKDTALLGGALTWAGLLASNEQ
jgi:putative oxidoreductase